MKTSPPMLIAIHRVQEQHIFPAFLNERYEATVLIQAAEALYPPKPKPRRNVPPADVQNQMLRRAKALYGPLT